MSAQGKDEQRQTAQEDLNVRCRGRKEEWDTKKEMEGWSERGEGVFYVPGREKSGLMQCMG